MTIAVPRSNISRFTLRLSLLSLISLWLTACSSLPVPQFPGVYKIPIAQGNIITQDMIDKLEPGMTPRQVIFVMGSPLVRDPFNQDRWDYVYNYQPGGGVRGQERITLYFENEQLMRYEGDFEPGPNAAWHQVANNSSASNP
ncbi:outer membrane protein assembly factor BamE [Pseudohongiella spirulinae]|uniref:Outer membrane protein assembly factor BamE n=1 Tax=Pseudohongiella spirulinae TaxID=1249552 RepID=A0A0S2KGN8_9GAMM|nr:Outer membrane protein assembly factor BamE [Pseudohongiella spirulinae]